MSRRVVITAGGTGGHMFPAAALAEELTRRGQEAILVCDRRGARYAGHLPHHIIAAASPSGSLARRLGGLARLGLGFAQSLLLLRRLRPQAVAALGGYASAPVALAALLLRIPVLVHEQNAVLGRANRLIARRAAGLALSFDPTRGAEAVPAGRRLVCGNPVRAAVAARQGRSYVAPTPNDPLEVLVVGGSQGARVFGDVVPEAVALLPPEGRARLRLTQQCRAEDLGRVRAAYRAIGFAAELAAFFEDLPERLARAHLVISRSGASSVAELLALGRPALLVPYRLAADDHQRANAEAAATAGAAAMVLESELDAQALAAHLASALRDPGQLTRRAARARALGRPEAARRLADALDTLSSSPATLSREALA